MDPVRNPDPEPDSPDIDIAVVDPQWKRLNIDLQALCERAVTSANQQLAIMPSGELSFAFVDDAEITRLNRDFRKKDRPTNVLSFPADGHNPSLGDIVIARETCAREADEKRVAFVDHVTHLCVHGYLHLCGYDHETHEEANEMEALEIQALALLDIENPYEDKNV